MGNCKKEEGGEMKSRNRLKGDPLGCKNGREKLIHDSGPPSDWSEFKSYAKIILLDLLCVCVCSKETVINYVDKSLFSYITCIATK